MPFLFFQNLYLQHPSIHDRGALAVALDKIITLFLVGGNLFLDSDIKFLRHFISLFGVINNIEAIDNQRRFPFVEATEK